MYESYIALEFTKDLLQTIDVTVPTCEFKNHHALAESVAEFYCLILNKISPVLSENGDAK